MSTSLFQLDKVLVVTANMYQVLEGAENKSHVGFLSLARAV